MTVYNELPLHDARRKVRSMKSVNNTMPHSRSLWSVILSGGEGQRMKPFIEQWLGRHLPKQYCTFVGTRSMLEHTWDRADRLTSTRQKLTVVSQSHQSLLLTDLNSSSSGQVLYQPKNRDTAAGIFLPLTYIHAWNPEATIIVYPSDHFVYPEDGFTEIVDAAVRAAEHWTDRIIILGATPTKMEFDYGWVEKSQRLGWAKGFELWSIESFEEKPTAPINWSSSLNTGWLWNTMVVIANLKTLWDTGWKCFPDIMERFSVLEEAIGTQREGTILKSIYDDMPECNFSSDLLGEAPEQVGIMEMQNVLWCDWGRPERIVETLKEIGRKPLFQNGHLSAHHLSAHSDLQKISIG